MALGTPTEVASAVDAGATASVTTSSFTPTANSLLIAVFSNSIVETVTVTDTCGDVGAWDTSTAVSQTSGGIIQTGYSWAVVGPSPTSGAVTWTATTAQRWSCSVIEITGANNTTPFPQAAATVANQNSTATATLGSAPDGSSLCLAMLGSRDLTPTVDAAYTEFVDRQNGSANRVLSVSYDMTPTSASHGWTTLTALFCNAGILVEIQPPSSFVPRVIML